MGTYISIPYLSRRSVHVEQSKPVITAVVDVIHEEEPKAEKKEMVKEDVKDEVNEESKEEPKEDPKAEVKEEPKVEAKNEVIEAEVVIPELLPKQLSVTISSESEAVANFSEKVIVPPRIPEFQGNINSESHAIKKFNRRHRKHQQN
jgi:hypothetical protein